VKVKLINNSLIAAALLSTALMAGCGVKSDTPVGPQASTGINPTVGTTLTPPAVGISATPTPSCTPNATQTCLAATCTFTPTETAICTTSAATATSTAPALPSSTATTAARATSTATVTSTATGAAIISTATKTPTATVTATRTPTGTATNTVTSTPTGALSAFTATATATCVPPITLGTAANYVVIAGSTITNTGTSTLCGGLGLSPGSSVTGAPVVTCLGLTDIDDPAAVTAKTDLSDAYTQAANLTSTQTITAGSDIGGQTLFPGVYTDTGVLNIGSNLVLDAQGNPCAVFVFQVAGDLTVSTAGVHVTLAGGAQASNVYWQVAGAGTLGAAVSFVGNILDHTSISMGADAVLTGRLLAETGQVALSSDTITRP
jgi:Ice-binding-like